MGQILYPFPLPTLRRLAAHAQEWGKDHTMVVRTMPTKDLLDHLIPTIPNLPKTSNGPLIYLGSSTALRLLTYYGSIYPDVLRTISVRDFFRFDIDARMRPQRKKMIVLALIKQSTSREGSRAARQNTLSDQRRSQHAQERHFVVPRLPHRTCRKYSSWLFLSLSTEETSALVGQMHFMSPIHGISPSNTHQ